MDHIVIYVGPILQGPIGQFWPAKGESISDSHESHLIIIIGNDENRIFSEAIRNAILEIKNSSSPATDYIKRYKIHKKPKICWKDTELFTDGVRSKPIFTENVR